MNQDEDWKQLVSSMKLVETLQEYKDKDIMLDYGCGYGWASIAAAKSGYRNVIGVDIIENSKPTS